jgi:hypothetical protein
MLYSILRLREERFVVVLVQGWQLSGRHAPSLVETLQNKFGMPAMLVARDESNWRNTKTYAYFDTEHVLFALLARDELEWQMLPSGT